ncbi:hypothetical protein ABT024_39005 [Streptomyces sp. NPDC002812]|uniref:hypothetical protein n=1 Tax=Streptomyces sp. NPDC002812 TaxID=3154434 RepID=UPI00331E4F2F
MAEDGLLNHRERDGRPDGGLVVPVLKGCLIRAVGGQLDDEGYKRGCRYQEKPKAHL